MIPMTDILNDPMYQCLINCGGDLNCIAANCLGAAFRIGLTLENPTGSPIELTIPAGTTFAPDQSDVQTMMVLQELEFQIQPGDSKHCINVYCTNADLSAPGFGDTFATSGGISQPCLIEILNLTEGKTLYRAGHVPRSRPSSGTASTKGPFPPSREQFLEGL